MRPRNFYFAILLGLYGTALGVALDRSDINLRARADTAPVQGYSETTVTDGKTVINGPDGVYSYYNATHMQYHGIPPTNGARARSLDSAASLLRRQGCSTTCNGQYTDASDISNAQNGLSDHFASYPSWSGSIVYV